MKVAGHDGKIIALHIDTPALGDTIAAIPTLRKLAQAYEGKIVVFTTKPFLFENHPLVEVAHPASDEKELANPRYKIYRTFMPLMGKQHNIDEQPIEFRYSNMDFRQFHAISLRFTHKEYGQEQTKIQYDFFF